MCSTSIFCKAAHYEKVKSNPISIQSFPERNMITGENHTALVFKIKWLWFDSALLSDSSAVPFTQFHLAATCTCKFYKKEIVLSGKLCCHVIGQLRQVIFFREDEVVPFHSSLKIAL